MRHKYPATLLLLICATLFSGCATTRPHDRNVETLDPYEKINRRSYAFTDVLDRKIAVPVTDFYIDYVPLPMQRAIGNFYTNLAYPDVILNDFLQGKVKQGFKDTLRLVVNSTIGGAGFFDMASPMGLPQHDEDFGQTLGVWGVDANTYVFIPLLGPSSNRDVPGIAVTTVTNGLFYIGVFAVSSAVSLPISALGLIDKRARLSGPMQIRDEAALDPYLFVRDAYLQQRKHLIYDGNPPLESYDDFREDQPSVPPAQPLPQLQPSP